MWCVDRNINVLYYPYKSRYYWVRESKSPSHSTIVCNWVGIGEVIKYKREEGAHKIVKVCYLATRIKEIFLVSAQEHSHWSDLKDVRFSHTVALPSKALVS